MSLKATSWPGSSWFLREQQLSARQGRHLDQKWGNLGPLKFLHPSHCILFLWRGCNNYLSYFSRGDEVIEESDDHPNNMMEVVNSNDIIYLSTTMAVLNDVLLVIQSVFPPCYDNDSFLISLVSFLRNQPTQGASISHQILTATLIPSPSFIHSLSQSQLLSVKTGK